MKLPSVSWYAKISSCEIKLPDMILGKLFNSRLGTACSHLASLLFKLQACAVMYLSKVPCTSKFYDGKSPKLRQIQHLFWP